MKHNGKISNNTLSLKENPPGSSLKSRINDLHSEINNSIEKAKAVEKITLIAKEISDFAMKTRLLSLNAHIEASHAGAFGKSFAVVAVEMCNLSDNISEAVSKINDINDNVLVAMENLLENIQGMNEFMTQNVVEDYTAFAKLGEEYGDATLNIRKEVWRANY